MMKLLIIVVLLVISWPAYEDYQGGGNPALPSLLKLCHSALSVNRRLSVLARRIAKFSAPPGLILKVSSFALISLLQSV